MLFVINISTIPLLLIVQLLTKVMSGVEGTYSSLFEFGNAVCD